MRRHPECDQLAVALAAAVEELRREALDRATKAHAAEGFRRFAGFGEIARKPGLTPITPR